MYKFKINRRGVSPVIATLLLVAIAVAASVVTYTWAMSMVANQSAQSQTGIKIDQVLFGKNGVSANGISVALRNTGSIAATIQSIYVFQGDKFIVSITWTSESTLTGNTLSPTSPKSIGITNQATWTTASLTSGGVAVPQPTVVATTSTNPAVSATFGADLAVNTPYIVRVVTSTGFVAEGTYYTPGSFT